MKVDIAYDDYISEISKEYNNLDKLTQKKYI